MRFQVTFDGSTVVDNPIGWDEITTTITQVEDVRGLVVQQESSVQFEGTAYSYLKSAYDSNYCASVTCDYDLDCGSGFTSFYKGIILLKDVEFDIYNCIAAVDVKDDSYLAKIQNNKKAKAVIDVGISKNGDPLAPNITPVTPISIEFLNPDDGMSYSSAKTGREVYRVYDTLRFLIDYMTDGTVGFESDYFNTGEGQYTYITTGLIASTGAGTAPNISYEDFFNELNKLFNIGFAIEESGGNPVIRIENITALFNSTTTAVFNNVNSLKLSTDIDVLYASVRVGDSNHTKADDLPTFSGFPDIRFLSFDEEDYTVVGECSEDKVLDLVSDWVIDSNTIQDIVGNGNDDFDEDILFIQVDSGLTTTENGIDPTNPTTQTYFPYNAILNNKSKIERWFEGIPNSIAKYLSDSLVDTYAAHSNANQNVPASYALCAFQIEDSDPSTLYDNTAGNYKYTSPANGVYTFELEASFTSSLVPTGGGVAIEFRRYDSGASLVDTQTFGIGIFVNPTSFTFSATFYLDVGDYVQIYAQRGAVVATITLLSGSISRCIATENGGGQYEATGDALRFKLLTFDTPVEVAQMLAMMANTKGKIELTSRNGISTYGWIRELPFKLNEMVSQVVLVTDDTP